MQVETNINIDQDITVEVSWDNIYSNFLANDNPDQQKRMLQLMSQTWNFFYRMPDSVIFFMNKEQKETIQKALQKQADRFLPTTSETK